MPRDTMDAAVKPEFRYQPTQCQILSKHVWAIVMKQPDGSWRIVNCLDKDEACFSLECAFTTDHGVWPYPTPLAAPKPQ
jgi:hypothetical protein